MTYYSGFSLVDDDVFFKEYLIDSPYCVSGFSYGAIRAFEYVLNTTRRVDKLQLFSPAFFQNRDDKFKRLQLLSFKKNEDAYIEQFISKCFVPFKCKYIIIKKDSYSGLKELLEHEWNSVLLNQLRDSGVVIEIFLGSDDAIIDAYFVKEFFQPFGTVFFINGANHFLQRKE